jgi:deoxycytidine triphosphate deaminase
VFGYEQGDNFIYFNSRYGRIIDMGKQKPNPKSGILTRSDIIDLSLIEDSDDACFQHASYDLRLGDEYLIASHSDSIDRKQLDVGICSCKEKKVIVIPPFTSAILSTFELVKLPGNVAGRFDLKIKPALRGLMVQMGTQIEPWYHGRLFALVHNISDQRRLLTYNSAKDSLFNIEFHYMSGPSKQPEKYKGKKYEALSEFLTGIDIGSSLDSVLDQIRKTKEDVNKTLIEVRGWNTIKVTLVVAVATLFIGIFLPFILNKITYDKDDYPLATANQVAQISTQHNNIIQYYITKQMEYDSLSRLSKKVDKNELIRRKNEIETLEKYLRAMGK